MIGDEDDDDVWFDLLKTVKPLKQKSQKVTATPKKIRLSAITVRDMEIPRFETRASPLPQKQIKKLKTQKVPIEARLDLHGYTVDHAHQSLERFMMQAIRMQFRCLEIITGRGTPHLGTGQLKRLVPLWLENPHIKNAILHVEINPLSRGGSLLVLLRRTKGNN